MTSIHIGCFGAGVGALMLANLDFMRLTNIHQTIPVPTHDSVQCPDCVTGLSHVTVWRAIVQLLPLASGLARRVTGQVYRVTLCIRKLTDAARRELPLEVTP